MKIAALLTFVAPRLRNEEVCRIRVAFREPHFGLLYPARCFTLRGKHTSRRYADALPTASSGLNAASGPAGAVLRLG
jgi:hypothetical protein